MQNNVVINIPDTDEECCNAEETFLAYSFLNNGYVKELAEFFWGIKETHLIKVEGLDAEGADVPAIMENAIAHIKAEDF